MIEVEEQKRIKRQENEEAERIRLRETRIKQLKAHLFWSDAKSIYNDYPELLCIPLTDNKDTALHVAVSRGSTDFVREFVNYRYLTAKDLELRNADGNTAFCLAAMKGKSELLKIMIQKNENLPLIHGQHGMLPVHLAFVNGFHQTVRNLCSRNLLEKMAIEDNERLFFMAINNNMYSLANELVTICRKDLVFARDDEEKTGLHIMALKPFDMDMRLVHFQELLVCKLWFGGANLESEKRMKLINTPSVLLFDAIESGNLGFLKTIFFYGRPEPWELKDPRTGQTILHIAVLFRQHRIMDFILGEEGQNSSMRRAVDNDLNNALHFAARQPEEASLSLRPDIRMQRELEWFQGMEKRFPSELRTMRNKDGKTPNDMFSANHRKLSNEVKDTAKIVANSGMVVAALIVVVAFAAALTTPGGNTNAWFVIFILANGIALFTSALSIVAFLSIFTSSTFNESEFVISLDPNLIIGKKLLFISLITMIMAFDAASFLIFGHKHKWAAYVLTLFGLLTIAYILQLQLSLFDGLICYFSTKLRSFRELRTKIV